MNPSGFIKYGVRPFVYSNIFIALCAAAYTAKTSLLLYGNNGSFHVNAVVFCAILLIYCFHRMNRTKFLTSGEHLEERNNWMNTHRGVYYVLITASLITLFIQLFYMPVETWLVFIPVGVLGVGYTFPIIPTSKGWKRLRDIYWLKTFWIAFAVSWLTTFLPVVYTQHLSSLLRPEVAFIFARSLLFLFAICIPFDIRDTDFDKLKGLTTLPVQFGVKRSVNIAVILLLLFILLVAADFFYFNLNTKTATALSLSAIATMVLIPLAKPKQPALVFPLLYDSAMLVQWVFVIAFIHC